MGFPHLLFLFLDGVGLGADAPDNPFSTLGLSRFEELAAGQPWTASSSTVNRADHVFRPIDATLGVEGLPQSGTGQATLFTGVNCARVVGRHFGPYPHSKTKRLLGSSNLFHRLKQLDLPPDQPAAFANAYPDAFFQRARQLERWTVTTLCCLEADVPVRTTEDLYRGRAIPADLTGEHWPDAGGPLPISESEAGRRLSTLSRDYPFTLFEYYLTDKVGHGRLDSTPSDILASLDRFLDGLLTHFDPDRQLLLITSDHGNLENVATESHTRNPVPLVAYGSGAAAFSKAKSLVDVTPSILTALTQQGSTIAPSTSHK